MTKILVIPDAHARPDQDNTRFDALGNFIADKRPDLVVCIGDWADMGSLCSYDVGTKSAEGRRYQDDIEVANDALERTMQPVRKAFGKNMKRDAPEFHITIGNHENRITRAANTAPHLHGKLSLDDLSFQRHAWRVHPFLSPLVLEGTCFQHYATSGPMARPISGVNHARSLVMKGLMSQVVGHSHQRDFYETTRADGKKLFGLVVGCYDEGHHDYAIGAQQNWWSGLVMLHECHEGSAEPAFYSLNYVKANYL